MKLSIALVLFCVYISHGSDIWYQAEMSTHLLTPFKNVYTTLRKNIFDKLLTIDSNTLTVNNDTLSSFVSNIHCEVETLVRYLDVSVAASNNIRIKVDHKLTTIINDISLKESEIARLDGQIQDINRNIQAKQSQISTAEQSVRQAEGSVADAENALVNAEREVEDAKLCAGLFGRRKRFLGNVWNSIQNSVIKPLESAVNTAGNAIGSAVNTAGNAIESAVNAAGGAIVDNIVKPVCSVINFQQVDNARRNVENKKNELSFYRNQVQTFKTDLNKIQSDLAVFSAQIFNLNYQLNNLKTSLIALPNEQHIILSINQKLIDIVSSIRTLLGGPSSFLDAMALLIDWESIVKPLNAIYDELQQNQFMVSFNIDKISMELINEVKSTFQIWIPSISSMPLNIGGIRCSN